MMLHERIGKVQKKTESNTKFVIATSAVLTTLVTVLQLVPPLMDRVVPMPSQIVK